MSESSRACSRCTASRSRRSPKASLRLDPSERAQGALRGDRRARGLQPHPDPVLRSAAAPPRRGAHPRPRRLPHRRPADRLPPRCAARVRRDRRQELRGHPPHGAQRPQGRQDRAARTRASARPSRCCSPPCSRRASPSSNAAIEPEIMDLIAILQKMGAIISVEPNRVILIEGVDTLHGYDHRAHLRPQRGRELGVRRARDRRRHLRRRREAAGDADVPQRLPQGRRRVRHPRGRHPLLPPAAARSSPSSSRPMCTPDS